MFPMVYTMVYTRSKGTLCEEGNENSQSQLPSNNLTPAKPKVIMQSYVQYLRS